MVSINERVLDPDKLDQEAINGVVHGLTDGFMLPPSIENFLDGEDFSELSAYVDDALGKNLFNQKPSTPFLRPQMMLSPTMKPWLRMRTCTTS
ncbi:MAG: hypothetical protein KTR25_03895 [Myxococcales bacterium]|nr:hypothetical protein [Myxococcales bacterium]